MCYNWEGLYPRMGHSEGFSRPDLLSNFFLNAITKEASSVAHGILTYLRKSLQSVVNRKQLQADIAIRSLQLEL